MEIVGIASAGARVGSLTSPMIAMLGDITSPVLPLAIYGIIVLFAGIVSLWLWPETKGETLFETLEETEFIASSPNPWIPCLRKSQKESRETNENFTDLSE